MNGILGSGLIQSSGWSPTWLIRDEFTDTVSAGSVNGTAATPGPGTRAVVDTENKLSLSGGALAIAGGKSSLSWGDPEIIYNAIARSAGLCVIVKINSVSVSTYVMLGWDHTDTVGQQSGHSIYFNDLGSRLTVRNSIVGNINNVGDYAPSTEYWGAVIQRSSGAFFCILGGDYTEWTMIWCTTQGNGDYIPGIANYSATISGDFLRVTQLPAPFDSDTGLATDVHAGSVSAGTTFSHEANALIEYTLTTRPSADNADVLFRVQDASNYWVCRVDSAGDISLIEVAAGTPTTRGTAAGVVSSGHRVVVIADGTTIRVYSNNILRITYASATNFATATAGELDALGTDGVVSDLIAWPRTLSGTAAAFLDKASA